MSLNVNLKQLEPLGPALGKHARKCYEALSRYCRTADYQYLLELNSALNSLRGAADVVSEYVHSKITLSGIYAQNRKTRSEQLSEAIASLQKREPLTRESKHYGPWVAEESALGVHLQLGFAENKALKEFWEEVASQGKSLCLLMDWETAVMEFVITHLNESMRKGD